ncbi:mitochondrial sodium/calcium exchanger protein-like [Anopheles arabiensis]|uniref:Sodium/calcium exchanger membrane region domain-containing protein n=1 Tax=Anopheles arabiensis TaxID=7173 RepID=A0A182I305_ANOAR|nr:mitochondrial sodium/calcium exchanger protein-like [Anopheles arabiensis]
MEPAVTLLDLAQNSTPHYEAHQNIFVSLRAQPCSNVHSVLEDERCLFVRETEECRESMHYLDYMHFVYCIVDSSNVLLFTSAIVALLLFVLLLGTLIYHLCVTRYVDSVLYVAKSWRLNEYIAGVTLLTYGNGLAQVLSELKHHTSGDTELIYNQYLGTAVYQVSFLAALVIWTGSFAIYPEVIVPNLISLMVVSLLVEEFMYDEQVGIVQTTALGVLYLAFLGALYTTARVMDREGIRSRSKIEVRDADGKVFDTELTATVENVDQEQRASWLGHVWQGLRTFREEDFRAAPWYRQVYLLCSIPVEVVAVLLLPKVNFALPLHGWNKCLFIVNLILFPLFLIGTALVDMISSDNLGWICLGSLIGSACFSVIVCSTSCYDSKPPFFTCIGLFAIFGTSYVIMLLSYELIAILEALSIIANVSSASFAITILAWGSCWIDLITLRTLAMRGYSRIGFAACLGAPVFNILIGLCTVFCVQMIRSGTTQIHVRDGTSGPTCAIYLFVTSMTILLSVLFTRFEARKSIAFCLTTLYVTFLAYVAFCEFEVTHGYGTDHNDDGEYFLDRVPGRREH